MRTACSPPTGCHRCGGQLSGRRKAYCCEGCGDTHRENHDWGWARDAALRATATARSEGGLRFPACADCGGHGGEVHHIVPLVGSYGVWTCQHHQSNLRVLCQRCHLRVHVQIRAYMAEVTGRCDTATARDQARLAAWVNAEGVPA